MCGLLSTAYATAILADAPAGPSEPAIGAQVKIGVGNSPFRMRSGRMYARHALAFADFDGDGEEELLTTVEPDERPLQHHVAVLRWAPEGWRVKSKTALPGPWTLKMLVGDIDDDPLPEIVLFGEVPGTKLILKVVQWDGEGVAEAEFHLTGKLGLLADLDGDGKDELVLVRTRVRKFDAVAEEPSDLLAYEYRDGRFALTHKRELATGVAMWTSADLDGDGRREVVTSEMSVEGAFKGRLSVYRFEPGGVVSVAFRRNRTLRSALFFGAFRSGGTDYLFVNRGRGGWQSVFRIWMESGTFRMAPVDVGAETLPVFEDARLATAAYSEERGMFFQFADGDRTRLVPVGRPSRQRRSP